MVRLINVTVVFLVYASTVVLPSSVYAIGLPEGWERNVWVVESIRQFGKPCPPKRAFSSPTEEKEAPDYCPFGTGFTMNLCTKTLLFSNRHILSKIAEGALFIRGKLKDGKIMRLRINPAWQGHPNSAIDIAASQVALPESFTSEQFDFPVFDEDGSRKNQQSFFLKLEDIRVGDRVLMVGYPGSIPGVQEILKVHDVSIFRGGIVSAKVPGRIRLDDGNEYEDILLVDTLAFYGNSGSPVFLLPEIHRYSADRPKMDFSKPYIIGVQGAIFGNAGLAVVHPVESIEKLAEKFPGAKCPPPVSQSQK